VLTGGASGGPPGAGRAAPAVGRHGRTVGGVDRLLLVASSPRVPAGVLSWPAWEALRAGPVHAADPDCAQALAVRSAGIPVAPLAGADDRALAFAFRDLARGGRTAVWLAGPDGDPGFARTLGDLVAREPGGGAELEVVYGSWDPPGARLLDVVAVMDRLRSPGGCPWDAEQTHSSLMPYLLEEAYEAYDALADGDRAALREELGDVLLQVVFHARLAEEAAGEDEEATGGDDQPWSIDDVAGDLVAKLVRRHPHVFADHHISGVDELHASWDRIKREEKKRTSALDGVAQSQPALSLVAKYLSRVAREQVPVAAPQLPAGLAAPEDDHALGEMLFALVVAAREHGLDAEAALRRAAHAYADRVRAAEANGHLPDAGAPPR
jgi:XTP/dITP diphosphohydrolase